MKEVDVLSYGDLTTTETGKPFYRGKTESGCEIFMSDAQMEAALESDTANIDGTFTMCPEPFFQVVFLRVKVGENRFTVATALLPNKQEKTYTEVLEKLVEVCASAGKELDFVFVHSDCEQAIINSVKKVFSQCRPRLCRFHVVDAIRRFANGNGLRPIINQRSDFKRFYGRVRQIFFFPPSLWPRVWNILVSLLGNETKEIPAVQRFLSYLVCFLSCSFVSLYTFSLFLNE